MDAQSEHVNPTRKAQPTRPDTSHVLEHGPFVLDRDRWRLTVAGREVRLTASQFRLLAHLMRRPSVVFSRDALMDAAFGDSDDKSPKAIDQLVHRLRCRLGSKAGAAIETVRDVGYRLREENGDPRASL